MNVFDLPENPEPIKLIHFRETPPKEIVISIPLTPVQTNTLRDLMRGETMTQAARNAQIHRSTLHRWMQQDNFRLTLENAQRELHVATFFQIQNLLQPALNRLGQDLVDPKTSPSVALRIYQCLAAQQHKALPPMPTTARETEAIMDNLLDPTTPDLDLPATKCDTLPPAPEMSQPKANATECDTPAPIPQTSQPEAPSSTETRAQTTAPETAKPAQNFPATIQMILQLLRRRLTIAGVQPHQPSPDMPSRIAAQKSVTLNANSA